MTIVKSSSIERTFLIRFDRRRADYMEERRQHRTVYMRHANIVTSSVDKDVEKSGLSFMEIKYFHFSIPGILLFSWCTAFFLVYFFFPGVLLFDPGVLLFIPGVFLFYSWCTSRIFFQALA